MNQSLIRPMGALDPYGMQGGEFQQNPEQLLVDNFNPPSNPMAVNDQPMMNPQMAAYGAALMNIGDIIGNRGPSQNVAGAYMTARAQNDKMRSNKRAMARQAEQDELNTRYRESQITKNLNPLGSSGQVGTISPKDFTADSIAAYQQSGNIEDLRRYTPKVVDIGGIKHRETPEGWKPVVDINSPDYIAQINQQVALDQEKQSKLDFTTQQSKWQAGEVDYLNSINSAESNVELMSTTADRIRELVGANTTGYGGLVTAWPDSESRTLRGLLDTIKANSAFSTLTDLKKSGGTLGAISAPELVLLERKLGALDQAGDGEELLRVLDQVLGQNLGTVDRLRYGYEENKKRYGTNLVNDTSLPLASGDDKAARLAELRKKHGSN